MNNFQINSFHQHCLQLYIYKDVPEQESVKVTVTVLDSKKTEITSHTFPNEIYNCRV